MGNLAIGVAGASYYAAVRRNELFNAYAAVTAPVIYTTAAGTGGPLLWNGTTNKVAVIIGVSLAVNVAATVVASLGFTGNTGQTAAPTPTTAITASGNNRIGGPAPSMNVYNVGTVTNAGNFFIPFAGLSTGALTTDNIALGFIDVQGQIEVPPNCWLSVAASATATTAVCQIGLIWAEIASL